MYISIEIQIKQKRKSYQKKKGQVRVVHIHPCIKHEKVLTLISPYLFHFPYSLAFSLTQALQTIKHASSNCNSIKSHLRKGETLYGLFLRSFSPVLAEITGHAGYDYVVVDMEHGYGDIPDALPSLQALSATGTPAILRLPECSQTWAKKALDVGPQGVTFPLIDTPEMARKAVSYCRYPPNGLRGAAHPVVRGSKYGLDKDYLNVNAISS